MRHDSRLSRMLHVLIHMDRHAQRATSDNIAQMLGTNPVVVRRTMAGLREQGYVRSEKGHGGGWTLARPLSEISMLDIYQALGEPPLFAIGLSNENPSCLVEQAVNASLTEALDQARALLLERLSGITLADLAADFEQRYHTVMGRAPD
ncbi:Rrf2 family transcriptional regulator [Pseudomonas sp. GD03944]|uniref:Rrf2 family transcriptional regulator n=1 Tax=Pseudomonas sp. GD03944 TaxID=2975409 RepID=UPI00244AE542|nr:Rrf2 family transcriptional regulator [Pseudomonas sp. GD03944]MDH1263684.1 Rrf2 family transcriptional regulator [Pseudomonas sp. GD03944]